MKTLTFRLYELRDLRWALGKRNRQRAIQYEATRDIGNALRGIRSELLDMRVAMHGRESASVELSSFGGPTSAQEQRRTKALERTAASNVVLADELRRIRGALQEQKMERRSVIEADELTRAVVSSMRGAHCGAVTEETDDDGDEADPEIEGREEAPGV